VDHNKLWKILRETGIPVNLTCLLRKLYGGQEAIELDMGQQTGSKSGKGTTDDEMVVWHHQLSGHEFKLREMLMDREA